MNPFYVDSTVYGGDTSVLRQTGSDGYVAYVVRLASGQYVTAVGTSFNTSELRIGATVGGGAIIPLAGAGAGAIQMRVDTLASNGFAVTYSAKDGSDVSNIFVQRFDAAGAAVGSAITVNTILPGNQSQPKIAGLIDGGFVVTWSDFGATAGQSLLKLRTFDASGTPTSVEITVQSPSSGNAGAEIVELGNGGFALSWIGAPQGGSSAIDAFYVQTFSATGVAAGPLNRIAPNLGSLSSFLFSPVVTVLASGDFLVAWVAQDSNGYGVKTQIYAPSGIPRAAVASATPPSTTVIDSVYVTTLPDGRLVLVWHLNEGGSDFRAGDVRAQVLAADGSRIGTDFLVSETAAGGQYLPSVVATENDAFSILWRSYSGNLVNALVSRNFSPVTQGGETADDFNGSATIDRYAGQDGDDRISGQGGDDALSGDAGDDRLIGGAGNDVLAGGIGKDVFVFAGLGNGTDRVVDFSVSDDRFDLAGASFTEATSDGVRTTLTYAGGTIVVDDVTGLSLARWNALTTDFYGNSGNDLLVGTAAAERMFGLDGDDVLRGLEGADVLDGGTGVDTADFSGAGARVFVNLTAGVGRYGDAEGDTYTSIENAVGTSFNDILTGDANANMLVGGLGNDAIYGLAGDDLLIGGLGADQMFGGDGIDTVSYAGNFGAVWIDLVSGRGQFNYAEGDVIGGVENIIGTDYADRLVGDTAANRLDGGLGDDRLDGGSGDDRLDGGIGADVLDGGPGADVLIGGGGRDTVDYSANFGGVWIDLETGAGRWNAAEGDTLSSIEDVIGTDLTDWLFGNTDNNRLVGGTGDDRLQGRAGNDVLVGGLGADVLDGGSDVDTADYSGNFGAIWIDMVTGRGQFNYAEGDTLIGIERVIGTDYDDRFDSNGVTNIFTGGAGNDLFTFQAGFSQDIVTDFTGNGAAAGDTIRFGPGTFTRFEAMMAKAVQQGSDVVITLDPTNILYLQNVQLSALHTSDFIFG